ncbi:MAG: hypothetical protein HXY18_17445 [Bryobacteraceae bacterium]|nr:hypothetical protein [Bryobacteraceae bacterium]
MQWIPTILIAAACASAQPPAIATGTAVGSRIPAFEATDQTGKLQTFESLRGPSGLVLEFVRSADW